MGANERRVDRRRHGFIAAIGAALIAAVAIGCGGLHGRAADGGAATVGVTGAAGALAELQEALPTGQPGVWYTQRLAALDYRVTSLRREYDGVTVYRVVKAEEAFDVRVAMDEGGGAARSVEIRPLAADAAAGDAESGADAVATSTPVSFGAANDGSIADGEAAGRREPAGTQPRTLSAPESRSQPPRAAEPSAPRSEPRTQPAVEQVESRPPVSQPAVEPAVKPAPAPTAEPASAPPAPQPRSYVVTVPAGSRIEARLDKDLSSANAAVGDAFSMTVRESIWVDGHEVVPAGAQVWGSVSEVERARRPNKGGRIVLVADAVRVGADELPIDAFVAADGERLEGRDSTHEDIKEVAIGAGIGGVLGGILGGKKGVLIGILVGGGGTFVATKGEEVELAADTPLYVELRRDLEVTFIRSE